MQKPERNVDLHTFNILSICSGVGGLELGLKLAIPNSRAVCYVEGEAYAAAVLAARMEEDALDKAPVWSDLRTFDGRSWRGKVDCIAGGYPCQPFSFAGKRQGVDDRRHLWPVVAALVRTIRPPVCFFENVRGHLSLGFREVAADLQRMGYAVKAGLFSAAEVGASHNRERLFILAYRDSDGRGRGGHDNSERQSCPQPERKPAATHQDGLVAQPRAGADGAPVADCAGFGGQWCKFCRGREWKCQKTIYERDNALGAFPPAPNDIDGWASVADDIKPTVLRMANGLADRLDRIRACGNGVVPLVAAHAWRTLTADLELKWNEQ